LYGAQEDICEEIKKQKKNQLVKFRTSGTINSKWNLLTNSNKSGENTSFVGLICGYTQVSTFNSKNKQA
jgi:hypothetical protein